MFESINRGSLTGQRVLLPPLAEQCRIVDLVAATDALRERERERDRSGRGVTSLGASLGAS